MSRSVAPRSAPGGDWARAARSEGCSGVCVGDYEGIMNGASATAFLPNFVGFPSPRGLHSSTVQPRSAPLAHTCAFTPPALSTPLNVPQHFSPPARLTAHGEAPAGRRLPTDARGAGRLGRGSPSGAQLPRVSCLRRIRPHRPRPRRTTRLRRTTRRCRKNPRRTAAAPAGARTRARTRAAGPPAVPGPARTPRAAAPRSGHDRQDGHRDECHQDDASDHGATLLPFPRSGPRGLCFSPVLLSLFLPVPLAVLLAVLLAAFPRVLLV